jgi:hypothetical protein
MTKRPSFKQILEVAAAAWPSELDERPEFHVFIQRWSNDEVHIPAWETIAAAETGRYGMSRETCLYRIALAGITAMQEANPAVNNTRAGLRLQQKKLLELAAAAQLLANHYRSARLAPETVTRILEVDASLDELDKLAGLEKWEGSDPVEQNRYADEYAQFHEEQAKGFRGKAARVLVEAGQTCRQSNGRRLSGEQGMFIRKLAGAIRGYFGKPYYEVTATIANFAYPSANELTAEDVGTLCRRAAEPWWPPEFSNPVADGRAAATLEKVARLTLAKHFSTK